MINTTTTRNDMDMSIFSDVYKDAYGFRPRGLAWEEALHMSEEEFQAELDSLVAYWKAEEGEESFVEDEGTFFEQVLEEALYSNLGEFEDYELAYEGGR